jgi:LruC domain-containing protein
VAAWAAFACLAGPNSAHAEEVQHYPGLDIYGTLMVEDGWPQRGDEDYNDAVIRYNIRVYKDASGKVSRIIYSLFPEAYGATVWNGLALRIFVPMSTPHLAQIRKNGEAPTVVTPVAGETDLVFVLWDVIRDAFPGAAAGDFINTQQADPVHLSETLEFEVQFDPPLDFSIDSPFDFFAFRSGNYAHQIHLPQFGPTDLALKDSAIADLFGTEDDCSNQVCIAGDGSVVDNTGRYYVDKQGVLWAIEVAAEIQWPAEGKRIDQAYPMFLDWAMSGGETNTDWYLHGDPEYLYNLLLPPAVPGLYPGAAWVLLGIVAGLGALRLRRPR